MHKINNNQLRELMLSSFSIFNGYIKKGVLYNGNVPILFSNDDKYPVNSFINDISNNNLFKYDVELTCRVGSFEFWLDFLFSECRFDICIYKVLKDNHYIKTKVEKILTSDADVILKKFLIDNIHLVTGTYK